MPGDASTQGGRSRVRGSPQRFIAGSLFIGWLWVGVLLVAPGLGPGYYLVLLANGFAAALYLGPLYWVRDTARDRLAAAAVMLVASSHMLWLLFGWGVLFQLGFSPFGGEDTGPFLITGVVFAVALGLASWSWVPLLAMVGAGVAAEAVAWLGSSRGLEDQTIGVACAVLHAVMVSVLAWETRGRLQLRDPDACDRCGYSRAGIPPTTPCPECGREHTDG